VLKKVLTFTLTSYIIGVSLTHYAMKLFSQHLTELSHKLEKLSEEDRKKVSDFLNEARRHQSLPKIQCQVCGKYIVGEPAKDVTWYNCDCGWQEYEIIEPSYEPEDYNY